MHFYQAKSGNNKRNNKHVIFFINNSNTTKHRIYNLKMKIQIKEKCVHVILAMQKTSLSILSLNQQLIKEKCPFLKYA